MTNVAGESPKNANGNSFTGNSRNAIIKEAQRGLEISENKSNKTIIILDVYDTLLDRTMIDGRSREKGVYRIPLKVIILNCLINSGLEIETTERKLRNKIMSLVLSRYFNRVPKEYYYDLFQNNNKSDIKNAISNFREATENSFRRNIKSALDSMENDGLIRTERYFVAITTENIKLTRFDDSELVNKINEAEKWAMNQMPLVYNKGHYRKVCDKRDLYRFGVMEQFLGYYNTRIYDKYNWSYTYKEIYVSSKDTDCIYNYINKIMNDKSETTVESLFNQILLELNNIAQSSSYNSANRRYKKMLSNKNQALQNYNDAQLQYQHDYSDLIGIGAIDANLPEWLYLSGLQTLPDNYMDISNCYIENEIRRDNDSEKIEIDQYIKQEQAQRIARETV